ncbi:MAG: kelch repeat-containing protein, partial [Byssovorax sp.]
MGPWTQQKTLLGGKRTLAGAATVGRYIYLVGGDDGAGPTDTAERALILSPREAPVVQDVDLALGMIGLDAGEWHYRVSAVFAANDTDNPGGESLPSDAFSIKIPTFPGKKIAVTLVWSAPVDSLGAPLAGVAGYNIYRSAKPDAAPGTEVLVHTVKGAATVTFTDDGTAVPGTATPLPTGSTGAWLALPKLGTKRAGLAVAAGSDPATPGTFYVYALLGKSDAATANTSYELLPVTIAPNGRQTVAAAWTAGAQQSSTGRWQLGAWTATSAVSNQVSSPDTFIFLGAGLLANGTTTGKVEAVKISAGGDLGLFNDTPKDFSATNAGYGVCAANGQLFVFGGAGGMPSSGAKAAQIVAPAPTLANNSWNSEGLTMTQSRYLMGSSVQSAFIFLLGGQTGEPSNASQTTELVIW